MSKPDKYSWIILFFLSALWGCSFFLIKKSLVSFDAVQVACLRLGISSLAFTPFLVIHFKNIIWKDSLKFFVLGLAGSGIPAFLFAFAQTKIDSSLAGLLNSLTPIWTLIIGIFIFKLKFNQYKLFGVFLGFFGAALLILLGNNSGGDAKTVQFGFALLIVIATVCYGVSVNMIQAYFYKVKPIIISTLSFVFIGYPCWVVLFMTDFMFKLETDPNAWNSLIAVTALSIFGTVLASVIFFYLVQRTSAVFGSTVTYLMPIMALFLGFMDGESIGLFHILGMSLILIGVYFSKKEKIEL